jgi:hypothetical protein
MGIVSRANKRGVSYANFGCSMHYNRGASICINGATVSEKKVNATLFAALQSSVGDPECVTRFVMQATRTFEAARKSVDTLAPARKIAALEKRIANATSALVKVGWSDAIGAALKSR